MRLQFRIIVLPVFFNDYYEAHLTGQMCLIVVAEEFRDNYEAKLPPHSYLEFIFPLRVEEMRASRLRVFLKLNRIGAIYIYLFLRCFFGSQNWRPAP